MNSFNLLAVERVLHDRQARLHRRIAVMAAPPERGGDIGFGKRIGDGTLEAVTRLTDIGVGGSLEATQERVDRALDKLQEGTYGVCDACSRPIAAARMQAAPESVLCIACARRAH